MYKTSKVSAVILAAGFGRRMGDQKNKLLLSLEGKSVLSYTVKPFCENCHVDELILVAAPRDEQAIRAMIGEINTEKTCRVILGGDTRQASSYLGTMAAEGDIILIHDGARPFTSQALINRTIDAALSYGAAVPLIEVTDTMKTVSEDGFVSSTVDRKTLKRAQTPQGFQADILRKAHEEAREKRLVATDDSFLVEQVGFPVKALEGENENIKLTVPSDMAEAKQLLKRGSMDENRIWV